MKPRVSTLGHHQVSAILRANHLHSLPQGHIEGHSFGRRGSTYLAPLSNAAVGWVTKRNKMWLACCI